MTNVLPPSPDSSKADASRGAEPLLSDLLIMADGTVLAHNLTVPLARILHELNPEDLSMRQRAQARNTAKIPAVNYELPN